MNRLGKKAEYLPLSQDQTSEKKIKNPIPLDLVDVNFAESINEETHILRMKNVLLSDVTNLTLL